MPRKTRRPARRRRRRGARKPHVSRTLVPYSITRRHRYVEQIQLNPGVGGLSQNVFRLNSVFDPNLTGVGHQPMGFDQYSALYERYRVKGCRVTVTFSNSSGTVAVLGGIGLRSTSTLGTIVESMLERPLTKWKTLGDFEHGPKTVSIYYNPRTFHGNFGIRGRADDDQEADVTTNPLNDAYAHVFAGAITPLDDPGNVNCTVVMTYITEWFEPKALQGS